METDHKPSEEAKERLRVSLLQWTINYISEAEAKLVLLNDEMKELNKKEAALLSELKELRGE